MRLHKPSCTQMTNGFEGVAVAAGAGFTTPAVTCLRVAQLQRTPCDRRHCVDRVGILSDGILYWSTCIFSESLHTHTTTHLHDHTSCVPPHSTPPKIWRGKAKNARAERDTKRWSRTSGYPFSSLHIFSPSPVAIHTARDGELGPRALPLTNGDHVTFPPAWDPSLVALFPAASGQTADPESRPWPLPT